MTPVRQSAKVSALRRAASEFRPLTPTLLRRVIHCGLVDQPKPRKFRSPQVFCVCARRGEEPTDLLFDFDGNKLTVFWEETNRVYPTSDLPWWLIQRKLFDAGVPHPD